MYPEFRGRVALITGGSSGIGRETARAFAQAGARVVVSSRRRSEGERVVQEIRAEKGEAEFVQADVSQAQQVRELIEQTVQAYGRLDYAFNNAGIEGQWGPLPDCPEDIWDQVIDINLKGVWLCMKYEIPHMLEQRRGAIVNMASVAGLLGTSGGAAPYVASKHGVVGLTRTAAMEYARKGIRINAVCPAIIETPMAERLFSEVEEAMRDLHPMGRFGKPSEVADAVLWLCSDAASFVLGHSIPVDGGIMAGFGPKKRPE